MSVTTPETEVISAAPEDVILPPCEIDSDEPPLESELHLRQIILLIQSLEWLWRSRHDFYAAGNLSIYYNANQLKSRDFRGPDFFVVLGTERKPRKSWVVWAEEGKYPNLIIEILSASTAKTDRQFKKQLYQNTFRTPEYFWFDPQTLEFQGFSLVSGEYQPLKANQQGRLSTQQLGLYLGIHSQQLRFFDASGNLIPTPEEVALEQTQRADNEANRANSEANRADNEAQRAERLAAKLRELNIDPDAI
ncbi:MAG: Uma2 family endonuclease [Oscillatoria sp. PMC 1068.18]|nr:Uma2 family endonuclease [Oscillatoria sp. PMC 1076.18]MEC4989428.1 Uma2 family endonuclease [Oscillatoria sp. PMC 1068.18]